MDWTGAGDVFASTAYKDFLQQDFGSNWKFQIITNGNLLIKNEKIIDRLKDKITSVDVSLDAGSDQTYKDVRGGNFDIVKKGIMMCVDKNIRTNREVYVCPVFNEAIKDGLKVKTFEVDKMWGIGTPEALKIFLDNHK